MRYKTKLSPVLATAIAVLVGVTIEMVLCALFASLAGKGTFPEDNFPLCAVAISGISAAIITMFVWFAANDEKMKLSAVGVSILLGLQVVCGLLFWGIEWTALLINGVVMAGVCFAAVFMLSRQKKPVWAVKKKKSFC